MFLSVTCRFNLAPWFSHQNSWHEFCLFKLFQKHPKTCHKHWPITIEVSGFIVSRTALFRARFTHLPQPLIAATTNPTPNIIKIIHAVHASLKRSRLPHQKKVWKNYWRTAQLCVHRAYWGLHLAPDLWGQPNPSVFSRMAPCSSCSEAPGWMQYENPVEFPSV